MVCTFDGKTARIHAVRRVGRMYDCTVCRVVWPYHSLLYLLCSYVAPCEVMYIFFLAWPRRLSPLLGLV